MALPLQEGVDMMFTPKVRKLGHNHTVSTEMQYDPYSMCTRLHIFYNFDDRLITSARDQAHLKDEIYQVAESAAEKIKEAVIKQLMARNMRIFQAA